MTWTKLGEDFPERLLDLSDAAFRLHVAATIYVNHAALDGYLPWKRLDRVPVPSRARRPAIVAELIEFGLWSETGEGWTLTDFFDAQLSAEEVRLGKQYANARQAKRFARPEDRAARADAEQRARQQLNDARQRRRDRLTHVDSRGNSHVSSRALVSSRLAPSRKETRARRGDAPPSCAAGVPTGKVVRLDTGRDGPVAFRERVIAQGFDPAILARTAAS